jgi:hypothetical protein
LKSVALLRERRIRAATRALASLIVVAVAALVPGLGHAGGVSQALARQRALESYSLMQRFFYAPSSSSYNGTYPPKGVGYAQVWPYSQALEATLEIASLPGRTPAMRAGLLRTIANLAPYRARLGDQLAYAPLRGGKGNAFYDDNVWIGLELVSAADLLHDPSALAAAQRVFTWIRTGWDTTPAVCRGGVYWLMPGGPYWMRSARNRYRAAVSTVNGALLGLRLYEHTHLQGDLAWAERAYSWSRRCLGTSDGLVADHIDAHGNVVAALHSYNQGAMVATAVNLYLITRKRRYLDEALRTAAASLMVFRDPLASGEPASFLAIYYGDLLPLMRFAHSDSIRSAIAAFAAGAWSQERDSATGLFKFGHTYDTLLDQAAMVQIYSELAET